MELETKELSERIKKIVDNEVTVVPYIAKMVYDELQKAGMVDNFELVFFEAMAVYKGRILNPR